MFSCALSGSTAESKKWFIEVIGKFGSTSKAFSNLDDSADVSEEVVK